MRPPRPALAAFALLSMLTTACQPAEPDTPSATIATSSSAATPTPATVTPDPSTPSPSPSPSRDDYAIPEVIDEAYAQRVLEALYSLESEAVRQMVAAGEVTDEAAALMRAANRPTRVDPLLERYRELAVQGFPGVLEEPGDQVVTVTSVISGSPECLFASGTRDFTAVAETPEFGEDAVSYFQLLPKDPGQDREGLNLTPWMVAGGEVRTDGTLPEDPCIG